MDSEEVSNRWEGIVTSLEERYNQGTSRVVEKPLATLPTQDRSEKIIASVKMAIENIINSPSVDDTPLFRVRCKVTS